MMIRSICSAVFVWKSIRPKTTKKYWTNLTVFSNECADHTPHIETGLCCSSAIGFVWMSRSENALHTMKLVWRNGWIDRFFSFCCWGVIEIVRSDDETFEHCRVSPCARLSNISQKSMDSFTLQRPRTINGTIRHCSPQAAICDAFSVWIWSNRIIFCSRSLSQSLTAQHVIR